MRLPSRFPRPEIFRALFASLFTCAAAFASDWTQWRGPTRDGISTETAWSYSWGANGPKLIWKAAVGIGCSSFTVANGRAYTMGNQNDLDTVYCFDVTSGKILWKHSYPQPLDPNLFEGGPGSTPTLDGSRVYTVSRHGWLHCLEEGRVVWRRHLVKDLGGKQPQWGYNGSPLILGDTMLLEGGGPGHSALALQKLTGDIIWKVGDDIAGYASPLIVQPGDNPGVAFFNAAALVVRTAREGRELWRFPWKTQYDVNAAMPMVVGDGIFVSSGYGHGAALIRPKDGRATAIWETKAMRNQVNSSVLWQGHLYGFDESSFTCLEAATGKPRWKQGSLGKGSLILAAGKLVVMSETGKLVIVQPTPEKYSPLAEAQVLSTERCWVVPTLSDGRLFVKNNLGEVAVLDLRGS